MLGKPQLLLSGTRASDIVTHLGGEEFPGVMSNASIENAATVADRLSQSIARHPFEVWPR